MGQAPEMQRSLVRDLLWTIDIEMRRRDREIEAEDGARGADAPSAAEHTAALSALRKRAGLLL